MRASVLWTGGKDSALAMHEAALAGHKIVNLVTFVPREPSFLAHPLPLIRRQADAMGIEHRAVEIKEPYQENYAKAIVDLRRRFALEALITGDIAEVDGHPNWIKQCSGPSGLSVLTPLWGWNRSRVLERLLSARFKVIFSCVKEPWFTDQWLGRELDPDAVAELEQLRERTGLDICGEQGEYHTMVLDGPAFKFAIVLSSFSKLRRGNILYLNGDYRRANSSALASTVSAPASRASA